MPCETTICAPSNVFVIHLFVDDWRAHLRAGVLFRVQSPEYGLYNTTYPSPGQPWISRGLEQAQCVHHP